MKSAQTTNRRMSFSPAQTERFVSRQCEEYGFRYRITADKVFITTNMGGWMITLDDDGQVAALHHENHFCTGGIKHSAQYHRQDWTSRSLPNTLHYIRNHDRGFVKQKGRTNIDDIFEALEKQRMSAAMA